MTRLLTEETPGKVMGLLGASLFSLALMLGVSLTNASFTGTQTPLVDPFSTQNVVAVVDQASASYSKLLTVNFIQPLTQQYGLYAENIQWLSEQSGVTYALGLEGLNSQVASASLKPEVAGAYTEKEQGGQGFGIDALYSLLIR